MSDQAKQTIQRTRDDEATAQAKAEAAAKLALAQAHAKQKLLYEETKANPANHPIHALSLLAKDLEITDGVICALSLIATLLAWGLASVLPPTLASMAVKVGLRVFLASLLVGAALPFLPWAFLALVLAAGVWAAIEVILAKGNVATAEQTIVADVKAAV